MRGGGQLLELTPSQMETIQYQFDSFCRKVLREEARDYERQIAWKYRREISLSELSEEEKSQLSVMDEYPFEQICFQVQGYEITIQNSIYND